MIVYKLLSFLVILSASSAQDVGNGCRMRHDRTRGTCKLANECPIVFDLLRCKRIQPTQCGFVGTVSVVCCPNKRVNLGNCQSTTAKPITERISKRKCREYKVCENVFRTAIVGGIDAFPGEFPHMVAVGWQYADGRGYAWNCGGSLISENYVLTAAHCTDAKDSELSSSKPVIVRLGEHNIQTANEGVPPLDIGIANIVIHPEYKPPSKYHDIALIKLATPVSFTENIRPLCLWQTTNFPTETAIATGWGKIGYASEASDTLQKVNLNVIDNTTCVNFYNERISRRLSRGIIAEQLCAGDLNGGKDTCQGDSGGPLQIPDPELPCAHHLIGVTSFGVGCGGANSPAVYTRVSSYLNWIENTVWPQ